MNLSSPPVLEQKFFKAPDPEREKEPTVFTVHFVILHTETQPYVVCTFYLSPHLQSSLLAEEEKSPIPKPVVFPFVKGRCIVDHTTPEGYYLRGTIQIVHVSLATAQFYHKSCNFSFDIEYGHTGGPDHGLLGSYKLYDITEVKLDAQPVALDELLPDGALLAFQNDTKSEKDNSEAEPPASAVEGEAPNGAPPLGTDGPDMVGEASEAENNASAPSPKPKGK